VEGAGKAADRITGSFPEDVTTVATNGGQDPYSAAFAAYDQKRFGHDVDGEIVAEVGNQGRMSQGYPLAIKYRAALELKPLV
jgi:hypothetical protein